MCTAIAYRGCANYLCRTLDLNYHYHEEVVLTPRKFPLPFRDAKTLQSHYAMIGMAMVADGYPLYYDAVNEAGIGAVALRFRELAHYSPKERGRDNIATFEVIPWILGQCASMEDVLSLLHRMHVTDTPASEEYEVSPLHWMITDGVHSVTVEPTKEGLQVTENPFGVLTNEPVFAEQLAAYGRLGEDEDPPGGYSSQARFVRGVWLNSRMAPGGVSAAYRLMDAVAVPRGCADDDMATLYTAVCDLEKGLYCYTTEHCLKPFSFGLFDHDLDRRELTRYGLVWDGEQKPCP